MKKKGFQIRENATLNNSKTVICANELRIELKNRIQDGILRPLRFHLAEDVGGIGQDRPASWPKNSGIPQRQCSESNNIICSGSPAGTMCRTKSEDRLCIANFPTRVVSPQTSYHYCARRLRLNKDFSYHYSKTVSEVRCVDQTTKEARGSKKRTVADESCLDCGRKTGRGGSLH
ncbi:hypothetical protein K438DRAFT_1759840 [Mycena galopus ATCC 62051]|nr:hypothetical protein K438DRAFT_1759840 [Mycena galopus ATCC 62051]